MPKLWNETVEAHPHAVRDAIMETTAALAVEHGIAAVKMSQIAEQAGIGRATLYKYFPDVESILIARHQRHVEEHLAQLALLRDQAGTPAERLESVLGAYALICHHRARHGGEISTLVHRGEPMDRAEQQLVDLFRDLVADVAATGGLREDTSPEELATSRAGARGQLRRREVRTHRNAPSRTSTAAAPAAAQGQVAEPPDGWVSVAVWRAAPPGAVRPGGVQPAGRAWVAVQRLSRKGLEALSGSKTYHVPTW
ncbi:TetR/AcrR family transcriptional regulator [Streptacidiphilus jiangxiensis]|uniref:DNA-binding transcriptional regulator, AcrR family n=1 Tax=Streptacidiphilus jiangxiensis TaxID=235985 RepID=A0A1H7WHB0_STRJI|nr:TetR/AcrR family transcriptional regulator [Streptacidiphilus jiangxiensis]SEM20860.1 DNA-binding transcriptional regulator, AcrR family [Streptacidiphilus jiangxiensis]